MSNEPVIKILFKLSKTLREDIEVVWPPKNDDYFFSKSQILIMPLLVPVYITESSILNVKDVISILAYIYD